MIDDLTTFYGVLTDPHDDTEWPAMNFWCDSRDDAIERAKRLTLAGITAVVYRMSPVSYHKGKPVQLRLPGIS